MTILPSGAHDQIIPPNLSIIVVYQPLRATRRESGLRAKIGVPPRGGLKVQTFLRIIATQGVLNGSMTHRCWRIIATQGVTTLTIITSTFIAGGILVVAVKHTLVGIVGRRGQRSFNNGHLTTVSRYHEYPPSPPPSHSPCCGIAKLCGPEAGDCSSGVEEAHGRGTIRAGGIFVHQDNSQARHDRESSQTNQGKRAVVVRPKNRKRFFLRRPLFFCLHHQLDDVLGKACLLVRG